MKGLLKKENTKFRELSLAARIISVIIAFVLAVPVSGLINRLFPLILYKDIDLDLIFSFLISFVIIWYLVHKLKYLFAITAIATIVALIVNYFSGAYSFYEINRDYVQLVGNFWHTAAVKKGKIKISNKYALPPRVEAAAIGIKAKVNYKDSLVRNFAVKHSLEYFNEYGRKFGGIEQFLSLFKYINGNFKYVKDTYRDEYYASPMETIANGLGGDCDDHSILMASCLKAIGARVRLVFVYGHIYPELYCGDEKQFNKYVKAIERFFSNEMRDGLIHYHEAKGRYWINLDYSAPRPGGPFYKGKILTIINLD